MYREYLDKLMEALYRTEFFDCNKERMKSKEEAFACLVRCFTDVKQEKKQVFFIGNGGSAAIASHMNVDFLKNGGMRICSLHDFSVASCMSNDYGYEYVFSRPLQFLGNTGDLLVAISSSGNSQNIVQAVETAKRNEMRVITFTGFTPDNKVKQMGDYNVYVPVCQYGIVESIHNLLLQQIVDVLLQKDGVHF